MPNNYTKNHLNICFSSRCFTDEIRTVIATYFHPSTDHPYEGYDDSSTVTRLFLAVNTVDLTSALAFSTYHWVDDLLSRHESLTCLIGLGAFGVIACSLFCSLGSFMNELNSYIATK